MEPLKNGGSLPQMTLVGSGRVELRMDMSFRGPKCSMITLPPTLNVFVWEFIHVYNLSFKTFSPI